MRARFPSAVTFGFAVALFSFLLPAPAALVAEEGTEVARQVERLRSADWSERQAAEDALRAMGTSSIEGLLPFAEDADPEVAARVGTLLRENGGWRLLPSLVATELDRLRAELASALARNEWQTDMLLGWLRELATPPPPRICVTLVAAGGPAFISEAVPRQPHDIVNAIRAIADGAGGGVAAAIADRARAASGPVAWTFAVALGQTDAPETVDALARLLQAWDDEGDTYAYAGLGQCRQDAAFDALRGHYEAAAPGAAPLADGIDRRSYLARRLRGSPAPAADAYFGLRLDDPDPAIRLGAAARLERRGVDLHGYNPLLPVEPQAERIARIRAEGGTPPADPWARPAAYIRTSPIHLILRTLDDPALWGENDIVRRQFVAMIQAGMGMGLPMLAGSVGGDDPSWVFDELPKTLGALGEVEAAYAISGPDMTSIGMRDVHVLVHVATADKGIIEKLMASPLFGTEVATRRRHGEKDYLAIPLPEGEGATLYAAAAASGLVVALQESDLHSWLDATPATIAGFLEMRAPGRVRVMDPGPVGISIWCDGSALASIPLLGRAYRTPYGGGGSDPEATLFGLDAVFGFRRIVAVRARAGLLGGFLGEEVEIDLDPEHPLYTRWRTAPRALDLRRGIGKNDFLALAGTIPNAGAFWKALLADCERVGTLLQSAGETDISENLCEFGRDADDKFAKEFGVSFSELLAPFDGEACLLLQSADPLTAALAATHAQPDRVLGNLRRWAAKMTPGAEREHRGFTILPVDEGGFTAGATAAAIAATIHFFGGGAPGDETGPVAAWIDAYAGAAERSAVFEPGDGFLPADGVNLAFALNLAQCAEESGDFPPEVVDRSGLKTYPHLRAYAVFEERRIVARARLDVPITRLLPGLGGFVVEQFGEVFGGR